MQNRTPNTGNEVHLFRQLMEILKTYKFIGNDAFTLHLKIDFHKGNELISSVPIEFLMSHMSKQMTSLKYAYLPDLDLAFNYLDNLAKQITKLPKSYFYYYPIYILQERVILKEMALYILNKMDTFTLMPSTHYCSYNRSVDFFIIRSNYFAEYHLCLSSFKKISLYEFKNFLISEKMKIDYSKLRKTNSIAYKVLKDGEVKYALLVSSQQELLMLISI